VDPAAGVGVSDRRQIFGVLCAGRDLTEEGDYCAALCSAGVKSRCLLNTYV